VLLPFSGFTEVTFDCSIEITLSLKRPAWIVVTMKIFSAVAGSAVAVSAIRTASVTSNWPGACDANNGIDIVFSEDRNTIHARFPTQQLLVGGHGAVQATTGCSATMEWSDFRTSIRFAIANVTYFGNITLTGGEYLNRLETQVDFSVEHQQNTEPIKYPLVKDWRSSILVGAQELLYTKDMDS
jgi:hypothetical protein